MRIGLVCFAVAAAFIGSVWFWLGSPVQVASSQLSVGEKLYCVSYAPFRGSQTPFDPTTQIPAAQIEADLIQLAAITDCVRIYSADQGLEQVVPIAAKLGLKVLQGFWISNNAQKTRVQFETAAQLANQYPETVRAVVVGNEVLLRGDLSAPDLAATIRAMKARVKVPVTYADVWEFWLRAPDVAAAVDFVTIHILPYWEDFPIAAGLAGPHVDAIRRQVVAAFPGKEVIIGEVGWPSAGRMREGALPSPVNQARVVQDVLALAKRDKVKVNVIEAFDQPWKRALEGVVGGHWGLFDDASHKPKFVVGQALSNHPGWPLQAAGGIAFAALVFGAACAARRGMRSYTNPSLTLWLAVTGNAIAGGALIGMSVANLPVESLYASGWLRSLAFLAVAVVSPVAVSMAIIREVALPRFSRLIGPVEGRVRDPLTLTIGAVAIVTVLLALIVALGLVFDPRYRDFPFAPLTAAVAPLFLISVTMPRPPGARGAAEIAAGAVLATSVPYIVLNEGLANWQSLWVSAMLAALAFTLVRVRDARG
ncbi:MAG: beta-(1-6) glucans synthase [Hyphomicrobiales bacterium]|nr:beta-(1-6) glucans synthase [Hyphomicrobiales bacterium]